MFAVVWVGRAGAVVGTWVIWSSRPEYCDSVSPDESMGVKGGGGGGEWLTSW